MKIIDQESTKGKIIYALGMGVGVTFALADVRASQVLVRLVARKIFGLSEPNAKIKRDLYRLRTQKLAEIRKIGRQQEFVLTEAGRKVFLRFDYENLGLQKKKIWDRKWRMVLFDIPNTKTKARNAFRFKMKEMGCVRFNDSVWVYPYPCQKEIDFIANYWGVGKYVHFAVVDRITNEDKLCRYYDL